MRTIEQAIQTTLTGHGAGNPLTRDILLPALQAQGFDIRERELRATIARMVIDLDAPIGSATRGYFTIVTQADLAEADKELKAKAEAISVRRNCLIRNFNRARQGLTQGRLF